MNFCTGSLWTASRLLSEHAKNNVLIGHGTDPSIAVLVGVTGVEKKIYLIVVGQIPEGVDVRI